MDLLYYGESKLSIIHNERPCCYKTLFICFTIIIPFLLFLFSSEIANAAVSGVPGPRKIKLGPFHISPSFLIDENYTDNVFAESTDEKSDFITTFFPGIKLLLTPAQRHNLFFRYNARLIKNARYNSEDTNNHEFEGLAELNFRGGLSLTARDRYQIDHEPRGSSATGAIESFKTNTFTASAVYEPGNKFKFDVEYSLIDRSFGEVASSFRDRKENIVSGKVFYLFLPKTSAILEYEFSKVDYDSTSKLNSNSHSFLGGLAWEATAKSTGEVKVGYLAKNFDSPGTSDFSGFKFSGNIVFNFTDFTSLTVQAEKRVNESSLDGPNYFTTTGISATLTQMFTKKIAGTLRTSYGVDRYNSENTVGDKTGIREDKILRGGAGLIYNIQEWMTAGFDYQYTSRNSTFDVSDYNENSISLHVNFVF